MALNFESDIKLYFLEFYGVHVAVKISKFQQSFSDWYNEEIFKKNREGIMNS